MLESLSTGTILVLFVCLVVSITIHEAMHAFTSFWLGDDTAEREGRITLNPIKHIDPFLTILLPAVSLILFQALFLVAKPVPFNPNRVKFDEFGAALVGIVGPFTNLFLALAGAGLLNLLQGSVGVEVLKFITLFILVNVALFVFNMIPIPPLDGSRLVYAFAPGPVQRFMESLEQFGIFIIFALVLAVPAFNELISEYNEIIFNFLV
jgi:Zn-dependent protease